MRNYGVFFLLLASCAHTPKCGNPPEAKVILYSDQSCRVRIRQVTLGSELKIPESLKNSGFAGFRLDWAEASADGSSISLGHFILVKPEGVHK